MSEAGHELSALARDVAKEIVVSRELSVVLVDCVVSQAAYDRLRQALAILTMDMPEKAS